MGVPPTTATTVRPSAARGMLSRVAAWAALGWLAALIFSPLLDTYRKVLRSHREEYAQAPAGFLVNLGIASLALSLFALGIALIDGSKVRRAGAVLLLIGGLTAAVLTIFPSAGASGSPLGLGPVAAAFGTILISARLRRDPIRTSRFGLAIGFASMLPILVVAVILAPESIEGITARALQADLGAWILG